MERRKHFCKECEDISRWAICLEIATGPKQRGYWIPKIIDSSDLINAVFMALDKAENGGK